MDIKDDMKNMGYVISEVSNFVRSQEKNKDSFEKAMKTNLGCDSFSYTNTIGGAVTIHIIFGDNVIDITLGKLTIGK